MAELIFADLHNHTTASDGEFTPERMVLKAKQAGISVVGITDHDTLDGIERALEAGKKHHIQVVPGVEVSVRFKRSFFTGTLHLLCYFMPDMLENQSFVDQLTHGMAQGRGEKLIRARVAEINRYFGPSGEQPVLFRDMTYGDITGYSANATRRHFALALNEKFKITDRDLINSIIGNSSRAYLPSGIDMSKAAELIKSLPVLSVLAHPAAGSYPGKGHYREVLPPFETVEKLLPEFLDAGLHGLEINYPGHTESHKARLFEIADRFNLIVTGGSDCHDAVDRPPGVEGIDENTCKIFKDKLVSIKKMS